MPASESERLHVDCPDAANLVCFAEGGLARNERADVRAHVERCSDCLAQVAAVLDGATATRDLGGMPPARLAPGSHVGRYIVLDVLGSGGFATVYVARDPELDRRIALKLVHAPSPHARVDQIREARALARLDHPNVVAVHDVGTHDGDMFIAMDLVIGATLRQTLATQTVRWPTIRDWFVQAGRGLAAAHAAGLIHGDFKPGNVLLGRDGRVRVADFGLAQQVVEAAPARAGTPGYVAPEILAGEKLSPASDQYSFCVSLYEAVYGMRPGLENRAHGDASVGKRVSGERVPGWLQAVVARGLRADPMDRYATMDALVLALRDAARRRGRWIVGVAASVCLAFLAGAVAVDHWHDSRDPLALDAVHALVDGARAAAARFHFVYPPLDEPGYETAYHCVLALEHDDGGDTAAALEAAADLRREFADTLERLGDRYWDEEAARPFALDYYAQALVFDAERTNVRDRIALTTAQLADFSGRAGRLELSEGERLAGEVLAALADGVETAVHRTEELSRAGRAVPALIEARLETMAGARSSVVSRRVDSPVPAVPIVTVTDPTARVGIDPSMPPSTAPHPRSSKLDPAAELAQAAQAFAAGRFADARDAYQRVLRADRDNAAAVAGVARVEFQLGSYGKAAAMAKRAIRLAPRNPDYHVLLGDAYLRVLRYDDALASYQGARNLGSELAERRLAVLAKTLRE